MPVLKLTEKEQQALQEFKAELKKKFGYRLVLLKLFGSKARGDFHQESDLDILVIVRNLSQEDKNWIMELIYHLFIKYDYVDISPRIYSQKTWKHYTSLPLSFAYVVEKEGIKI